MNRTLAGLLLWAGWFLASADLCALLRIGSELLAGRALTPVVSGEFASVVIGVIALIVTLDIGAAYNGEPTV